MQVTSLKQDVKPSIDSNKIVQFKKDYDCLTNPLLKAHV
jgi:hypothetical protein